QRPRKRCQAVTQLFLLGQREREAIVLVECVVQLDTPYGTVIEQSVHVVVVADERRTSGIRNEWDYIGSNLAEAGFRNDIAVKRRADASICTLWIIDDLRSGKLAEIALLHQGRWNCTDDGRGADRPLVLRVRHEEKRLVAPIVDLRDPDRTAPTH